LATGLKIGIRRMILIRALFSETLIKVMTAGAAR